MSLPPQTINGLMRHLRNKCNVNIQGSQQKQQLVCYGYYHGYKGYRFFQKSNNPIPYTDFKEVVDVIEFDNNMKAALYPCLMFLETAIKNVVCNESVNGLKQNTFDYIYKERMTDNLGDAQTQLNRLNLRNSIYSKLSSRYRDEQKNPNQMVRHFYNRGEDTPIWVVFELLYLSDLANFTACLNKPVREKILSQINMLDTALDTNRELLPAALYTIKALRNAVAHNSIIFDARFKDRNINRVLRDWIEKEVSVHNITLYSLTDYIIIVCTLLKKLDFSDVRAKNLIKTYKKEINALQASLPPSIYNQIIQGNTFAKITALETYLNT